MPTYNALVNKKRKEVQNMKNFFKEAWDEYVELIGKYGQYMR